MPGVVFFAVSAESNHGDISQISQMVPKQWFRVTKLHDDFRQVK